MTSWCIIQQAATDIFEESKYFVCPEDLCGGSGSAQAEELKPEPAEKDDSGIIDLEVSLFCMVDQISKSSPDSLIGRK